MKERKKERKEGRKNVVMSNVVYSFHLVICLRALAILEISSFKTYFLVPIQNNGMYLSQLKVVMSKLKVFLSSSDITDSSIS